MTVAPLVELRGVSKSFGATRALHEVSFAVMPGEVHVLAGENGAGKSTLIRVLSGVISDFEGEMWSAGERVSFRDPRDATGHGVATIHQELSLVGCMTVADNLALGRKGSMLGVVRPADEARAARKILGEMDLDVDPLALVETLPLASQQLVEIARALSHDARVLILDEPTSALSEAEAERLLTRVERLAKAGKGIVYISHRMEENDRLAHRITVLRDGRVVASRPAKEMSRQELVALMMGRDQGAPELREKASPAEESAPCLEVRELRLEAKGASKLRGVSFDVGRGEIVGLAGLRGSGVSETLAALFGAFGAAAQGKVTLAGAPFPIESPARSIERGLVLLANDRKKTVLYDLDIAENITLSSLRRLAAHGVLDLAGEQRIAAEKTERLHVAAPSLRAPARALSGGNQQKVALLRCVTAEPKVLLLDEPTRGVDIGAKADIHGTLRALASSGMAIAVVTSELTELLDLCDRIHVLWRGRVTSTLEKKDFSREKLRLLLDEPPAEQAGEALSD